MFAREDYAEQAWRVVGTLDRTRFSFSREPRSARAWTLAKSPTPSFTSAATNRSTENVVNLRHLCGALINIIGKLDALHGSSFNSIRNSFGVKQRIPNLSFAKTRLCLVMVKSRVNLSRPVVVAAQWVNQHEIMLGFEAVQERSLPDPWNQLDLSVGSARDLTANGANDSVFPVFPSLAF